MLTKPNALSAYSLRDIQNFKSLLEYYADLDTASLLLLINNRLASVKTGGMTDTGDAQSNKCPGDNCDGGRLIGPYSVDGLNIMRCSKKCGYSEVVK